MILGHGGDSVNGRSTDVGSIYRGEGSCTGVSKTRLEQSLTGGDGRRKREGVWSADCASCAHQFLPPNCKFYRGQDGQGVD